ncbi:CAC [Symbiodinium necroappetens]|uniref:CAC protein n=1 Tax=Symbiodinium necroappetens TaxID=1628268 RepID=A0A812T5C1_9DINO|nr:CAC [Symbiodinium necroappetens]
MILHPAWAGELCLPQFCCTGTNAVLSLACFGQATQNLWVPVRRKAQVRRERGRQCLEYRAMVGGRRRTHLHLCTLLCAAWVLALLLDADNSSSTFTVTTAFRPQLNPERSQAPPFAGSTEAFNAYKERALPRCVLRSLMPYVGAGMVAATIQATLSEVEVFFKNSHDITLKVVLLSFRATLIANLLKFPFFEAIFAAATTQASPFAGGMLAGGIFATVTLPISNLLYRRSMKLPVRWSKLYEAYLPTLLRDMTYGILRSYLSPPLAVDVRPSVLFVIVFLACMGSSPFNQWRSFLLQHHSEKQPLMVYFKPKNYIGISVWAALRQGMSVGLGYVLAPALVRCLLSRGS